MTTSNPLQGKLILPFIAPPNGGKGTQTKILNDQYNLPTFDMGGTLRKVRKDEPNSELAQELSSYMDQGKLVPLNTLMKVFKVKFEELAANNPNAKGFILDGFPRSREQADALLSLCQEWGANIAKVIYLNVSNAIVKDRSTGRRFCTVDGSHVYNVGVNAPQKLRPSTKKTNADGTVATDDKGREIWLCDKDQAELEVRKDDEPEKVEIRLTEYREQTEPVIQLFKDRNELAEVNGEQELAKVTHDIKSFVEPLLGLTPSN